MERSAPNYHAIKLRYLGPTDQRGARVKLIDQRFGQSVTLSRSYNEDAISQARGYLVDLGYTIIGEAELENNESMFLVDEFVEITNASPETCKESRRLNGRGAA